MRRVRSKFTFKASMSTNQNDPNLVGQAKGLMLARGRVEDGLAASLDPDASNVFPGSHGLRSHLSCSNESRPVILLLALVIWI